MHVRRGLRLLVQQKRHSLRNITGPASWYSLMRPVLSDPTTLGSLMRRKLAPIIEPLQSQISRLRGGAA